jgi:hypothetical protein
MDGREGKGRSCASCPVHGCTSVVEGRMPRDDRSRHLHILVLRNAGAVAGAASGTSV